MFVWKNTVMINFGLFQGSSVFLVVPRWNNRQHREGLTACIVIPSICLNFCSPLHLLLSLSEQNSLEKLLVIECYIVLGQVAAEFCKWRNLRPIKMATCLNFSMTRPSHHCHSLRLKNLVPKSGLKSSLRWFQMVS